MLWRTHLPAFATDVCLPAPRADIPRPASVAITSPIKVPSGPADNGVQAPGRRHKCYPPSEASTIQYDAELHEPWETFQHKARELARQLFPKAGKIVVEQMKGGGYNRTVGITVHPTIVRRLHAYVKKPFCKKKPEACQKYVLRVPRFDDDPITQQVSLLKMLDAKLSVPTPKVIKYDASTNNVLEKPYMVQARIQGCPLSSVMYELNYKQWESVTRGVMKISGAMIELQSASPGEYAESNLASTPDADIQLEKFYIPNRGMSHPDLTTPNTTPSLPQDPLSLLLEQCERWRKLERAEGVCWDHFWDGFITISRSLHEKGFLSGPFALAHGDFFPRNILVSIKDDATVEITGVIDWDMAVFAPMFEAYRPPSWLWMNDSTNAERDCEDEMLANYSPNNDIDMLAKAIFVATSSAECRKYAFSKEAMLARRMFKILKLGVSDPWANGEAVSILQAWSELHPEDNVSTEENVWVEGYENLHELEASLNEYDDTGSEDEETDSEDEETDSEDEDEEEEEEEEEDEEELEEKQQEEEHSDKIGLDIKNNIPDVNEEEISNNVEAPGDDETSNDSNVSDGDDDSIKNDEKEEDNKPNQADKVYTPNTSWGSSRQNSKSACP